jgi:fido (protein-threonine AMPylation protein)
MKPDTRLLQSLQASTLSLSLAQLLALHPALPRRSAQRQLAQLVAAGLVQAEGQARARRYQVSTFAAPAPATAAFAVRETVADLLAGSVALSPEGREILAYVEQAPTARKPVGYQIDFLAAYQPNQTHYLPEALRRHLHRLGRTPPGQAQEPAGTYSRAILNRLLIDLSWASSHLEGNTYSRLDTRKLIEHGTAASGKPAIETQMILNHKAAIEFLVGNIDSVGFDRYTLLNLHSTLAENLLPNPADEGRVRQHAVDIGLSVYRPLSVPQQIDHQLNLLLTQASQIADPFEQSFFMMVHLPYLQPFADINKRTSRLAANLPLFKANLCPLTFVDVPEPAYRRAVLGVYEMTRVELLRDLYVWAYERSTQEYLAIRQELSEPDPLRLAWRDLIKTTVRQVVQHPEQHPPSTIEQAVNASVPSPERATVQALIEEELHRLHEGVLARYGLRPSEWVAWRRARALDPCGT